MRFSAGHRRERLVLRMTGPSSVLVPPESLGRQLIASISSTHQAEPHTFKSGMAKRCFSLAKAPSQIRQALTMVPYSRLFDKHWDVYENPTVLPAGKEIGNI
ncbi:hypothetical protein T265_04489 [Opisthorchis viverrini]|uniref:Uncharacterized protein n=1 Tax=Opisthorchis viverrini TaxID=6198 RepID=A0A074ZNM8_OPIVI|nr:hypothetical protein T265_04489 [Opisthorchis viverrini]KER28696.1 hypothetical protein T265_04489 [Opisthorchis viverrini]